MNHHVVSLTGDPTDSTVLRNLRVGLGHSLLAYKATIRGISKVQVGYQIIISLMDCISFMRYIEASCIITITTWL
jgi:hypothetical protein